MLQPQSQSHPYLGEQQEHVVNGHARLSKRIHVRGAQLGRLLSTVLLCNQGCQLLQKQGYMMAHFINCQWCALHPACPQHKLQAPLSCNLLCWCTWIQYMLPSRGNSKVVLLIKWAASMLDENSKVLQYFTLINAAGSN